MTLFRAITFSVACTATALALFSSPAANAQLTMDRIESTNRANNANQTRREPIRLIDNLWWVGHSAVGAYLITSPEGHILIDTTSTEQAPWTVESIVKAGFKLEDIRYILNTHTHEEHMGGTALFNKLIPHAELIASKESADVMATGGKTDFRYIAERDDTDLFEPVQVDRLLRHLDTFTVGDTTLTAHLTPGHTEGTTTWTLEVQEDGKTYDAVIFGGMSASGSDRAPVVTNELYPEIGEDFEQSFEYLRSLKCDVFLYVRAVSIQLDKKLEKRKQQPDGPNPFIDPQGCQSYIDFYELRYKKQRDEERAAL